MAGHSLGVKLSGSEVGAGKRLLGREEGAAELCFPRESLALMELLPPPGLLHPGCPDPMEGAGRGMHQRWELSLPFKDSSVTQLSPSPQSTEMGREGPNSLDSALPLWLLSKVVRDYPAPYQWGNPNLIPR